LQHRRASAGVVDASTNERERARRYQQQSELLSCTRWCSSREAALEDRRKVPHGRSVETEWPAIGQLIAVPACELARTDIRRSVGSRGPAEAVGAVRRSSVPHRFDSARMGHDAPFVPRDSSDEEKGMHSGEREFPLEKVPTQKPAPVTVPEAQLGGDGRDSGGLRARDVLGLQRRAGNRAVARVLTQVHKRQIQRVPIAGINVESSGGYPAWTWGGASYHFNMRHPDSLHITEDEARNHYYFTAERAYRGGTWVMEITDLVGTGHMKKEMKGKQEHKSTRKRYSELPLAMRQWFEANYDQIMAVS
jgi:hypothetical protein